MSVGAKVADRRRRSPARSFLSHARNGNLVWRVAAGQIRSPKVEARIALGTGFRASDFKAAWRVWYSELLAPWKWRKPRSPSPRPSPQRRGRTIGRVATKRGIQASRAANVRAPSPLGRAASGSNPKAEGRRKPEGRRPKEGRGPNRPRPRVSVFGFRNSAFGLRPSGFFRSPGLGFGMALP